MESHQEHTFQDSGASPSSSFQLSITHQSCQHPNCKCIHSNHWTAQHVTSQQISMGHEPGPPSLSFCWTMCTPNAVLLARHPISHYDKCFRLHKKIRKILSHLRISVESTKKEQILLEIQVEPQNWMWAMRFGWKMKSQRHQNHQIAAKSRQNWWGDHVSVANTTRSCG